jgi:hypothetical protein
VHGVLQEIDVGRRYLMETSVADLFFDQGNGFIHCHVMERNTKDSYSTAKSIQHV